MTLSHRLTITELALPAALPREGSSDFEQMVAMRNKIESQILGSSALSFTAEELLPGFRNPYKPRRLFVARVGDSVVARAIYSWAASTPTRVATVNVEVLAAHRGHGIGSALLTRMEGIAADMGTSTIQSYVLHTADTDGPTIGAPTGYGALPAADPGVRFLTRRGYLLQQIKRLSFLRLPLEAGRLDDILSNAQRAAGPEYGIIHWTGSTPRRWLSDLARLKSEMGLDDPTAAMHKPAAVWHEKRLLQRDRDQRASGRLLHTSAVLHHPTQSLVGFTEISMPSSSQRAAAQEDTLVSKGHRGKRLGMLLKATNLHRVGGTTTLVYTFNAEENRPMLDVNEALGFQPAGYEGAWNRRVR
jgi:GNAT superfamily N-acetyltransferase